MANQAQARDALTAAVNDLQKAADNAEYWVGLEQRTNGRYTELTREALVDAATALRGLEHGLRLCLAQMPDADAIALKMVPDAPDEPVYTLEEYKYALRRSCDSALSLAQGGGLLSRELTIGEFIAGALDGARKTINAQYPQCECGRWVYRGGKWSNNSGITLSEAECWQCHTLCNPDGSTVPPDTLAAAETVPTEDVSMAGVG